MSEQFYIDELDERIDAIIARDEAVTFTQGESVLDDLTSLGVDLRLLPRESFKLNLRGSIAMTKAGTETRKSKKNARVEQTITPYLTVKRAGQLVEFVKEVLGGADVLRTTRPAAS